MFVFGMVHNGICGFNDTWNDDPPFDIHEYGIDWDEYDSNLLWEHHDTNNAPNGNRANPFQTHLPHHLSHVDVPEPPSPFSANNFSIFQHQIQPLMTSSARNMILRCTLWISTLNICNQIFISECQ